MRCVPAATVLLFATFAGRPADAQPAPPKPEVFHTADGVRLTGLFHASPTGAAQNHAVVVLLYPPGPDRTMRTGDWPPLIDALNAEGFHVFRFDWRGHGASTNIVDPLGNGIAIDGVPYDGFFVNHTTGAWNQKHVKGGTNLKKVPNQITVKNNGILNLPSYFPVFVNDLAAVRLHLDLKNDTGDVNTSSIYVVGVGDTATLGMMWLASEWHRPDTHPVLGPGLLYRSTPARGIVVNAPAGADVAGCVWLSASRPAVIPIRTVQEWARTAPKLRDNNKMVFLYGEADAAGEKDAKFFYDQVLVAGGNKNGAPPVDQTFLDPIGGKTALKGVNLLGTKDVGTEAKVVDYLKALQKNRLIMVRKARNYISPYYVDQNFYMSLR